MLENSAFYSAQVLLCLCLHVQIGLSFLSTLQKVLSSSQNPHS